MYRSLAKWSLAVLFLITLLLAYSTQRVKFDYVFEDFFPVGDPDLEYYKKFKSQFENDNNYLLIGLVHKKGIFDHAFLSKVDTLVKQLEKLDGITSVLAISNTKRAIISQAGIYQIPYIHLDQPERLKQDSSTIYKSPLLIESLVSEDGKSVAIILKHKEIYSKEGSDRISDSVVSLIKSCSFIEYHVAGKTHAQQVFITKLQDELVLFVSASMALIIFFLAFAYRNWWGVIIPLAVVLVSVIWVMGFVGAMGKSLDFIMVLLPTIMFVVAMSDVVHIMTKYIEQLRLGYSKLASIRVTFKEVGLATFLTSLTTAIGFLTLLTASIKPIQGFGIYTAAGVVIAFIVAFTLLPASLLLLPRPKVSEKLVHRSKWFGFLSKSFLYVLKNGKKVITVNAVILVIALYGISQIYINTYLIEDLPSDDPLKQDFTFFDEQFGGSRPFELTITVNGEHKIFDDAILKQIDLVSTYLADTFESGNIVGPHTIAKTINQSINGGRTDKFKLPKSNYEKRQFKKNLSRLLNRGELQKIVAADQSLGRISARVKDIGSAISLQRTSALQQYIKTSTDTTVTTFKITGTSNLIDKNNEYVAKNMFQGLGIAFGIVAIIAGLLFRSFRMIIITLIPNVIPLLAVAGIMGIFGITLKLSTSIVFTIAFGIAVDDTIHFTSKLKLELDKGKSLLYALKRTYLSTGKAIVVTSIILSGGFLTLLLSSFGGTFYTGLLISLTLMLAVLIDLTLLPVLVAYFPGKGHLEKKK
ncbi:MAG: efflux RND transporter permease subunit [Bacteroidota bacterium]